MKKPIVVILHLGYWMLYLFLLVMFYKLVFIDKAGSPQKVYGWTVLMFEFALIPALFSFYTFYALLFNKLLIKKKLIHLFLSAVFVSFAASAIGEVVMYATLDRRSPQINWTVNTCISMGLFMSLNAFANGTIGLVLRGFISWYRDIKLKEELNKKNYEMELALVKSQLNPHFLFNSINNIDVLIEKDATKASAFLNKLSDILRFMLYETKTEKIPLTKELAYIDKYIDLQKIRTSNQNYVSYSVEGNTDKKLIPPMLFIPFIENAFKHAGNKKAENAINIKVNIDKDELTFLCENTYEKEASFKQGENGLGNDLIQKRLSLLYPGKHLLNISDNNKTYKAKLQLSLNEN